MWNGKDCFLNEVKTCLEGWKTGFAHDVCKDFKGIQNLDLGGILGLGGQGMSNRRRSGRRKCLESDSVTKWTKWKKVKSLSRVRLFATSWTVAHQAPPSREFSRREYWSGLPFPSPGEKWTKESNKEKRGDDRKHDPNTKICFYHLQLLGCVGVLSFPPGMVCSGVHVPPPSKWNSDEEQVNSAWEMMVHSLTSSVLAGLQHRMERLISAPHSGAGGGEAIPEAKMFFHFGVSHSLEDNLWL